MRISSMTELCSSQSYETLPLKAKQKDTKDPDEEEEVCPVCFDKPLH